jgi:membrane protein DedA with SNARE-associated domain
VRAWVTEHGRWLTLHCDDIDRATRWFRRHGGLAVFIGRLVPGVRTFISLPAGFAGQALPSFIAFSAVGTLIWTTALTGAGRLLGRNYERVSAVLDPATWVVFGAVVVVYVVRVARGGRKRA